MLYKPKGVLCQFTPEHNKRCLGDLDLPIPNDVYPIGRLDEDSEGLLLLSNDKLMVGKILEPKQKIWKTYLAQVEGQVTQEAVQQLEKGVTIGVKKKVHHTLPAKCKAISEPDFIPYQEAVRKNNSWLELSIQEGKNRQVRKMTAKVGFPTLRLVRIKIGGLELGNLNEGELHALKPEDFKMVFQTI